MLRLLDAEVLIDVGAVLESIACISTKSDGSVVHYVHGRLNGSDEQFEVQNKQIDQNIHQTRFKPFRIMLGSPASIPSVAFAVAESSSA